MKKLILLTAFILTGLFSKAQVKYYVSNSAFQPWGMNSNIQAMNQAFGAGNWIQGYFPSVNVNAMLQPTVCLIFLEGGDGDANALNSFLITNLTAIQNWVFNGGRLLINAAPNTGANINFGFGGVLLNYNWGPYSSTATNAPGQAGHPVFNTPFLPAGLNYTGNYWCHGYITGPITDIVIGQTPGSSLAQRTWGSGLAMFGSMTLSGWHSPFPNSDNFMGNLLTYLNVCCINPTITAVANPTAICAGQTSTLTGGGAGPGGTYTWTPGNIVGQTIVVSPAATTIFTVTGTTSLGCVGTKTVQLVVNPLPTITAVPNPTAICVGNSATVTLGGANTYTTNPGNIVGTPFVVTPAATTIYTVTGTSPTGCVGTKTFQVIVNPLPVVTPGSNSPLCTGSTLSLTVGAGSSYNWTGPNGFTSNLQNPTINNVTNINAGVYSVTVTSVSGCTASGTTSVTINAPPVISPGNTGPYCQGATISLTVAAYTTYSWTGPSGFTSNLQNPTINNGQVINGGVYTVSVTGVGGCMSTGTTNVIVNPTPTITATPVPTAICIGNSVTLFYSGATTYTTIPGNQQGASIVVSPTATTIYTVTGTSGAGCVGVQTVQVIVNPLPVVAVNNPLACLNQTINLTSSGGGTYAWSGPLGFTSPLQNPSIPNAQLNMSGGYTVLVTSPAGCTAQAVANVTVISLPQPTITSNSPVCVGATLSFTGGGGATYNWTGPNGFGSPLQNPVIPNVTMAANGIYTLIVTAGTCSNITTASVTVNPLPVPTATSNSPVCLLQPINFTGTGGTTYTWTGPGGYTSNAQNPVIAVAQNSNAGVYVLTVTNGNGCTNSVTTNVVINPLPTIITSNPLVCLGSNINLTSSGGTGYSWSGPLGYTSNLQNPVITNAQINMTGAYTVVVTSAQGCTAQAVSNVTVIPLPTANIQNNSPVCVGATLSFTGSGGATYSWTGPNGFTSVLQNPTIPNVSMAANGVYQLTVTAGSCTNATSANITINPLPIPTATSNNPVCLNQPINLNAGGGNNYVWTGPGGFTSNLQSPVIAVAQNSNAGIYTVVAISVNGCTANASTPVAINPLPNVTTGNVTVCVNTSINLSANGANTYSWIGPNGFTSNAQNPVIPFATMANNGAHLVIGTSAQGCTAQAVANVVVLPLPAPAILSNDPVCTGATLNFTATGGATYMWSGPNGFTANATNPSIPNAQVNASGTYILIASSGNCTASITKNVIVNPLPTPTLSSNSPVCLLQPINLTGSGGNTYVWVGPNGFSGTGNATIPSANNLNAGTYTATATDANGCINTATVSVSLNPLPVVSAVGSTLCAEKSMSLSASGGTSFLWVGPNGFTSTSPGVIIPDADITMAGTYSVTVTDLNGCSSTSLTNVKINALPTLTASANTPICVNQTINLTANSSSGISYLWQGPNNFIVTKKDATISDAAVSASGYYTVTVTDNIGCSAKATVVMLINNLPDVSISSDGISSCIPVCVNLNSKSSNSLTSALWTFGDGTSATGLNASKCFNNAGTYQIKSKMTDVNGCSNVATFVVDAYPIPVADFNFGPSKPIINDVVEFSDASGGANVTGWTWNFSHLKNNQVILKPITSITYENPGTYVVALVVTSDHGCSDTIVKPIVVGDDFGVYVPDAFSPNGDGLNDVFLPKGFGVTKYELNVFDRWGEKLFSTTDFNEGWNGAFVRRGQDVVEEGVYVWRIKLINVFGKQKEITGTVTVIK